MVHASTGYEVARPTRRCSATGRDLEVGERFVATLVQAEGGELSRIDFSVEAWAAGARPEAPVVGVWQSVVPPDGQKRGRLLDNDALLDLHVQLQENSSDASRATLRYVLALLMVRKRLLKVEPAPRGVLRVRRAGVEGDQAVDIPEPGVDETSLHDVSEQLLALIEGAPA
ncbi:MAG: hypothetical protein KF866_04765 [Phycisphaeraceae bacterium]|nr:hypothetical protein [Phycisphaeraceae bacterium]MCW5754038.1 hypothetical protein [Phycisphaeraceae bacterium]